MAVINLVNVVLLISFISTYWSPVLGDLIVWPRETVVVAGQSVQLDCSTDDKYNVNWWHVPVGSTTNEDVFISGIVVLPYHPRFKVEKNRIANSLTEFHLVITSVSREDAGKYTCIDRAGHGEQRGSQLIVLASATLVVKPRNTSALVQHRVQLDCSTSKLTAPVSWQYLPVGGGGGEPQDVFINGILLNGYTKRFQIQENMTTGAYNLVIPSVQFSDAGTYRCRDEDGRGEHVDANLHITGQTEDFDSSTYTYEPVTPHSSTENNQNNLWALLVLIVVPIGILIAVHVYKKRQRSRPSVPAESVPLA